MDGYYDHHTHVHQGQENEGTSWGEVIVAILVIFIILGIIAYFLFRTTTPVFAPIVPPVNGGGTTGFWVFATPTPNSAVVQSVTGTNRTIFSVQSTTNVTITVAAPASPVGQEFIIDNSRSTGGFVTLAGPTVSNTTVAFGGVPSRIVAGTDGYFIWSSATEVTRVS